MKKISCCHLYQGLFETGLTVPEYNTRQAEAVAEIMAC
jgi:hypothetical protein